MLQKDVAGAWTFVCVTLHFAKWILNEACNVAAAMTKAWSSVAIV